MDAGPLALLGQGRHWNKAADIWAAGSVPVLPQPPVTDARHAASKHPRHNKRHHEQDDCAHGSNHAAYADGSKLAYVPRYVSSTSEKCHATARLTLSIALAVAQQADGVPDGLLRLISPFRAQHNELRVLGKGGFGSVSLVQSRLDRRYQAMKTIRFTSPTPPWSPPEHVERQHDKLLREVRALSAMSWSPHVVQYTAAWIEPDWQRVGSMLAEQAKKCPAVRQLLLKYACPTPDDFGIHNHLHPALHLLPAARASSQQQHAVYQQQAGKHGPLGSQGKNGAWRPMMRHGSIGFPTCRIKELKCGAESSSSSGSGNRKHSAQATQESKADGSVASNSIGSDNQSSSFSTYDSASNASSYHGGGLDTDRNTDVYADSNTDSDSNDGSSGGSSRDGYMGGHRGYGGSPDDMLALADTTHHSAFTFAHEEDDSQPRRPEIRHEVGHMQSAYRRHDSPSSAPSDTFTGESSGSDSSELSQSQSELHSSNTLVRSKSKVKHIMATGAGSTESAGGSDLQKAVVRLSPFAAASNAFVSSKHKAHIGAHQAADQATNAFEARQPHVNSHNNEDGHERCKLVAKTGITRWPYLLYIGMEPVSGLTLDKWLRQRAEHIKSAQERPQCSQGVPYSALQAPAAAAAAAASVSPATTGAGDMDTSSLYQFGHVERDIFWQLVLGVSHVHAAGIIHRDVKPANIFVTPHSPSGPPFSHSLPAFTASAFPRSPYASHGMHSKQQWATSFTASAHTGANIKAPDSTVLVKLADFGLSVILQDLEHHGATSAEPDWSSAGVAHAAAARSGHEPDLHKRFSIHTATPTASTASTGSFDTLASRISSETTPAVASSSASHLPHSTFLANPPRSQGHPADLPAPQQPQVYPAHMQHQASSVPSYLTHTSGVGTASYAAPEQQRGGGTYGQAVDVYPLGLILLELLQPFTTGMERAHAMQEARQGRLPASLVARYPQETSLILSLLNADPTKRPTCMQLLQLLYDMWYRPMTVAAEQMGNKVVRARSLPASKLPHRSASLVKAGQGAAEAGSMYTTAAQQQSHGLGGRSREQPGGLSTADSPSLACETSADVSKTSADVSKTSADASSAHSVDDTEDSPPVQRASTEPAATANAGAISGPDSVIETAVLRSLSEVAGAAVEKRFTTGLSSLMSATDQGASVAQRHVYQQLVDATTQTDTSMPLSSPDIVSESKGIANCSSPAAINCQVTDVEGSAVGQQQRQLKQAYTDVHCYRGEWLTGAQLLQQLLARDAQLEELMAQPPALL